MLINLDRLKVARPALYRLVVTYVKHQSGTHEFVDNLLSAATRKGLNDWSASEPPAEPQINMTALEESERADIQRRADEAAAKNRLNEYAAQGLEESDYNFNLIKDFVLKEVKGYWSSQIVDAAVANLGPRGKYVLIWRTKTVAPPPPAPEPATEILEPLPNGEPRLPLDVDNRTLSRASKDQAKDWLARVNAGKLLRPRGGFGSKF